jgi:hypothetical protein
MDFAANSLHLASHKMRNRELVQKLENDRLLAEGRAGKHTSGPSFYARLGAALVGLGRKLQTSNERLAQCCEALNTPDAAPAPVTGGRSSK